MDQTKNPGFQPFQSKVNPLNPFPGSKPQTNINPLNESDSDSDSSPSDTPKEKVKDPKPMPNQFPKPFMSKPPEQEISLPKSTPPLLLPKNQEIPSNIIKSFPQKTTEKPFQQTFNPTNNTNYSTLPPKLNPFPGVSPFPPKPHNSTEENKSTVPPFFNSSGQASGQKIPFIPFPPPPNAKGTESPVKNPFFPTGQPSGFPNNSVNINLSGGKIPIFKPEEAGVKPPPTLLGQATDSKNSAFPFGQKPGPSGFQTLPNFHVGNAPSNQNMPFGVNLQPPKLGLNTDSGTKPLFIPPGTAKTPFPTKDEAKPQEIPKNFPLPIRKPPVLGETPTPKPQITSKIPEITSVPIFIPPKIGQKTNLETAATINKPPEPTQSFGNPLPTPFSTPNPIKNPQSGQIPPVNLPPSLIPKQEKTSDPSQPLNIKPPSLILEGQSFKNPEPNRATPLVNLPPFIQQNKPNPFINPPNTSSQPPFTAFKPVIPSEKPQENQFPNEKTPAFISQDTFIKTPQEPPFVKPPQGPFGISSNMPPPSLLSKDPSNIAKPPNFQKSEALEAPKTEKVFIKPQGPPVINPFPISQTNLVSQPIQSFSPQVEEKKSNPTTENLDKSQNSIRSPSLPKKNNQPRSRDENYAESTPNPDIFARGIRNTVCTTPTYIKFYQPPSVKHVLRKIDKDSIADKLQLINILISLISPERSSEVKNMISTICPKLKEDYPKVCETILDKIHNICYCNCCKHNETNYEMKCGHNFCKVCAVSQLVNLNPFSSCPELGCPICYKNVSYEDLEMIFGKDNQSLRYELDIKLVKESLASNCVVCKKCKKHRASEMFFSNNCLHMCKECVASNIRWCKYSCDYCNNEFQYLDDLMNEKILCKGCNKDVYYIGDYVKKISDGHFLCGECLIMVTKEKISTCCSKPVTNQEILEIDFYLFEICGICGKESPILEFRILECCKNHVCEDCSKRPGNCVLCFELN